MYDPVIFKCSMKLKQYFVRLIVYLDSFEEGRGKSLMESREASEQKEISF